MATFLQNLQNATIFVEDYSIRKKVKTTTPTVPSPSALWTLVKKKILKKSGSKYKIKKSVLIFQPKDYSMIKTIIWNMK